MKNKQIINYMTLVLLTAFSTNSIWSTPKNRPALGTFGSTVLPDEDVVLTEEDQQTAYSLEQHESQNANAEQSSEPAIFFFDEDLAAALNEKKAIPPELQQMMAVADKKRAQKTPTPEFNIKNNRDESSPVSILGATLEAAARHQDQLRRSPHQRPYTQKECKAIRAFNKNALRTNPTNYEQELDQDPENSSVLPEFLFESTR